MQGPLLELAVSEGWATGVMFLPDGGLLSTGVDTWVKRWSAQGDLVALFEGHAKSVDALALLPDGKRLLTGSVDASIRLWDLETGQQEALFEGHKKTVAGLAVSPDGGLAASASYDRTVRLWDIESATERAVLKGHANNVVAVRISPDGGLLASGGVGSELRLWSLPAGELLTVVDPAHAFAVIPAGFTPDGQTLLTAGADDLLGAWSVPDLVVRYRAALGAPGTHASALSPDGRRIAVTLDHAVRVFEVATGALLDEQTFAVKGVYGVSFSADGTLLATATADSCVRVWRL